MINILIRNLSLIASFFIYAYFFSSWKQGKNNSLTLKIIPIVIIIISTLIDIFLSKAYLPVLNIFLSICTISSIAMIYRVPKVEITVWTTFILSLNLVCEAISFNIIKLIFKNKDLIYTSSNVTLISTVITTLLGFAILTIIKLFIGNKDKRSLNLSSAIILTAFPILSIVILYTILVNNLNTYKSTFIKIPIISVVLILNICAILLYKITTDHLEHIHQISLQNQILESELKVVAEIKSSNEKIEKFKHDLKNKSIVLLGLIENEKLSEAKQYISEDLELIDTDSTYYCPDSLLNFLLNEKISIAKQKNVKVNAEIFISENTNLDKDILAIVVGNLFDNAIAATDRLKNSQKFIDIFIKQRNNDLLIEFRNNFDFNELVSRKNRKKEGYGIKNIESLVTDLGGIYKSWVQHDVYFASVVVFNIYKKSEH